MAMQGCSLNVCEMHDCQMPRLFVIEFFDGAGHRMAGIINGIAVAAAFKMNFGGVVQTDRTMTEHSVDFRKVVESFFGENSTKELFVHKATKFDSKVYFNSPQEFKEKRATFSNHSKIWIGSANIWDYGQEYNPDNDYDKFLPLSTYFNTEMKSALRQFLGPWLLKFTPHRPSVAMHVRRGDLEPGDNRIVPDSYYLRLVRLLRQHLPKADIHVWSSIGPGLMKKTNWKPSDFDAFRQNGVQVHLDEDDPVVTWAHQARADVFVASASFFSYIPAVLNAGCVIYPGIRDPAWMNGMNENRSTYNDELQNCLFQTGRGLGGESK